MASSSSSHPAYGLRLILSTAHDTDDFPQVKRATGIGISVAIVGNVLISLALNLQKLAHKRVELAHLEQKAVRPANGQQKGKRPTVESAIGEAGDMHSEGPSLNETEEDLEYIRAGHLDRDGFPFQVASSTVEPVDAQPLRELSQTNWQSFNYSTWPDKGDRSGNAARTKKHARRTFYSRLIPLRFQRTTDYSPSEATTLLPVDTMAEATTLNGRSNSHRRKFVKGDDIAEDRGNESNYLRSKLWWLGFLLMNVGEIGNFISYAWAPASVVAPLGTFALIANCLFAPLMLGERFRMRDLLGIAIAIIGAVTVVLASSSSDTRLDPDGLLTAISHPLFIAYSCVYILGAVVLAVLSESAVGRQWVFVDVGLCALFGGFTVLSTKALSTLLTMEWIEIFTEWITYPAVLVLIFTGVGQIRYLNRALMRFDSKVVIPIQFVFFNLSAIIGSAILFRDFERANFHQVVTFTYGCVATFGGVFMIVWAPSGDSSHSDDYNKAGRVDGQCEEGIVSSEDPASVTGTEDGARSGFESFGRKRAALVSPKRVSTAPSLGRRRSAVNLIGLSPAQGLLLVHTPPRDGPDFWTRTGDRDVEQDASPTSDSSRRRRMSWLGEEVRNGGGRSRSSTGRSRNTGGTRNVMEGQNIHR